MFRLFSIIACVLCASVCIAQQSEPVPSELDQQPSPLQVDRPSLPRIPQPSPRQNREPVAEQANATSETPKVRMEVVPTTADDMEIRRLRMPDGWLVFTKWNNPQAPSGTMCVFYPDPGHRWVIQAAVVTPESRTQVPTLFYPQPQVPQPTPAAQPTVAPPREGRPSR